MSCKNSEEKETPTPVAVDNSEKERSKNLLVVYSPKENELVSSPLVIKGKARGQWFFEASFPVELTDENYNPVEVHFVTAVENWMTEEFVPFTDTLKFSPPATKNGYLILHKANPSGLPENANSDTIKVSFY